MQQPLGFGSNGLLLSSMMNLPTVSEVSTTAAPSFATKTATTTTNNLNGTAFLSSLLRREGYQEQLVPMTVQQQEEDRIAQLLAARGASASATGLNPLLVPSPPTRESHDRNSMASILVPGSLLQRTSTGLQGSSQRGPQEAASRSAEQSFLFAFALQEQAAREVALARGFLEQQRLQRQISVATAIRRQKALSESQSLAHRIVESTQGAFAGSNVFESPSNSLAVSRSRAVLLNSEIGLPNRSNIGREEGNVSLKNEDDTDDSSKSISKT